MKNQKQHICLVDGSTYIFRAYHALPPLTRKSDGLPVGAISGFCNMLDKLVREGANRVRRYRSCLNEVENREEISWRNFYQYSKVYKFL